FQEVASILVNRCSFDVRGGAYLTFLVHQNGVTQVLVSDHKGSGIPGTILVHSYECPPDNVHVIVYNEVFLEMNSTAFGHVHLIQCHRAFNRPPFAYAFDVPYLGYVEGAPLYARDIPLQTRPDQPAFELEQSLFLPCQPLAGCGEFPGIAWFVRLTGPAYGIAFECLDRSWGQCLGGHPLLIHT